MENEETQILQLLEEARKKGYKSLIENEIGSASNRVYDITEMYDISMYSEETKKKILVALKAGRLL